MVTSMRQWWTVPGSSGGEIEQRVVPVPTPGPGEVLIRVAGAGVNRGELIGRPTLRSDNPRAKPAPSGIEFAGEVASFGEGVSALSDGQRVMGRGRACYADYVVVDQRAVLPVPDHLSDHQAAAIPNVFVTAHDALVTAAHVGRGEKVLITAGSSGVGTAALQIARHLGAEAVVATTRSAAKGEALRTLGATSVVDTSDPDWSTIVAAEVGPVDAVIDQVGGGLFPALLTTMAIEGRYISVGRNDGPTSTINLDLLARNRLQLIGVTFRTRSPSEALACSRLFADDLLEAFAPGGLQPVLDRTFPLDALPEAYDYMLTDDQVGKIVMVP